MKQTIIHLRKDAFKFSAAHMTVFGLSDKEALHGHNYQVSVDIGLNETTDSEMIPFVVFKKAILAICHQWDEKVLLPKASPYLQDRSTDDQADFTLCGRRYSLPQIEVVWLPVDNVTTESLSKEFLSAFAVAIESVIKAKKINQITVRVEEAPGQGSSTTWKLG